MIKMDIKKKRSQRDGENSFGLGIGKKFCLLNLKQVRVQTVKGN